MRKEEERWGVFTTGGDENGLKRNKGKIEKNLVDLIPL
jgi:hypothetical protein